jgi:hypothetical protein
MADIAVNENNSALSTNMNFLESMYNFLVNYWGFMLGGAVIIILIVIIFVLINKMEEERRERDEPGYQLYKTVKMCCDLNKDSTLIRKKFHWGTLPLIFIPVLGWFLMFVIKKECSRQVTDYQGNNLGWYRGDYQSQDNTWNFLVYKEKWLLFFETTYVIKAPMGFTLKKPKRDEKGNIVLSPDKKTPEYESIHLNLRQHIRKLANGNIRLNCTGLEQIGMYYKCPVYIIDEKGEMLDYRKLLEGAIVDNTYQLMTTRLLNTASKQMEKGMTFSPDLQFKKQSPIKTKGEEEIDKYE